MWSSQVQFAQRVVLRSVSQLGTASNLVSSLLHPNPAQLISVADELAEVTLASVCVRVCASVLCARVLVCVCAVGVLCVPKCVPHVCLVLLLCVALCLSCLRPRAGAHVCSSS